MGKLRSLDNTLLIGSDPASPCGQIAKLYFTDTFNISNFNGTYLDINQTNLAWDSDRAENFHNPDNYKSFAWQDVTDGNNEFVI